MRELQPNATTRASGTRVSEAPALRIANRHVSAVVCLPDAECGYYRGTRFDWSGVVRDLRNNRRSACSGTAAHTTGNEYHVCTLHGLSELFGAFFGCLTANLRLCTCTKSFCYFFTDLNCVRCFAKLQCLLIGIDTNKFYTCDCFINHSIHSVIACTAHTDYDDLSRRLSFVCHNF